MLGGQLHPILVLSHISMRSRKIRHTPSSGQPWEFLRHDAGSGSLNACTIFQISPMGSSNADTFCEAKCADGGNPVFPPIQGRDGNFYGTTSTGGTNEGGVVYELTPSGTATLLHHHVCYETQVQLTDAVPSRPAGTNGNFFGTTSSGVEVVFEFTSKHQYLVLHTFHSTAGGTFQSGLKSGMPSWLRSSR